MCPFLAEGQEAVSLPTKSQVKQTPNIATSIRKRIRYVSDWTDGHTGIRIGKCDLHLLEQRDKELRGEGIREQPFSSFPWPNGLRRKNLLEFLCQQYPLATSGGQPRAMKHVPVRESGWFGRSQTKDSNQRLVSSQGTPWGGDGGAPPTVPTHKLPQVLVLQQSGTSYTETPRLPIHHPGGCWQPIKRFKKNTFALPTLFLLWVPIAEKGSRMEDKQAFLLPEPDHTPEGEKKWQSQQHFLPPQALQVQTWLVPGVQGGEEKGFNLLWKISCGFVLFCFLKNNFLNWPYRT